MHGGFVQVEGDAVTVLAPVAELAEDIDVERARRALEAAEQRIAELGGARVGAERCRGGPRRRDAGFGRSRQAPCRGPSRGGRRRGARPLLAPHPSTFARSVA